MIYNRLNAAAWMNPRCPCDEECGCYWCILWGFAGPVPGNWPTAANPAKVPETVEPKVPRPDPQRPIPFEEPIPL